MALLGQGWDDPKSSAIMALAGGLLQGNMGAGLLGANDAYGQAKAQGAKAQLAQLQMQEAQMRMEEAARQRQFLQNLPMQGNNPLLHQAAQAGVIPVGDYLKSTLPKQVEFGKIDPKDYTPESLREAVTTGDYTKLVPVRKMDVVNNQAVNLYNAQPGQVFDTFDPNKPFNLQGGKLAPNQAFQNYEMGKARAGATKVDVNTGQKGLDNELKIRSDFRSEPIYKAHNEVQSAYSQITAALKQNSPAGDLAGATKIMKILDPGSVVRESELGMAMAASGALDRLQYYATNVVNGTKLTPKQRQDFQTLADKLYAESAKQYNAKRGEYEGFATDYGLNANRIVGPAVTSPKLPSPAAPAGAAPKARFLGFE